MSKQQGENGDFFGGMVSSSWWSILSLWRSVLGECDREILRISTTEEVTMLKT
jgi:hypothetical protein